jgi:hypothetical protein
MNKQTRPEMTRKQALAILHKAHDAVGWHLYSPEASGEEQALRAQMHTAFRVLDRALHGQEASYCPLCEFCYLHLCTDDYIQARTKGQLYAQPCCMPCIERLKAAQQLEYIEVWNEERKKWEEQH